MEINNEFYETLGKMWHVGQDHPVALLRAEAKLKNPWVIQVIRKKFGPTKSVRVLDVGCGGGLLSNELATEGFQVVGVDLSSGALSVAAEMDTTHSVQYQVGDAEKLPFDDESFDAVCCLDVLEHVNSPPQTVAEACRVLRPGGVFLFHTFNRTILSRLLVVHAVEIFFKNVPKNLHLYSKFITPAELTQYCESARSDVVELIGIRPIINFRIAQEILRKREVPESLRFEFCKSLRMGYLGVAVKR